MCTLKQLCVGVVAHLIAQIGREDLQHQEYSLKNGEVTSKEVHNGRTSELLPPDAAYLGCKCKQKVKPQQSWAGSKGRDIIGLKWVGYAGIWSSLTGGSNNAIVFQNSVIT